MSSRKAKAPFFKERSFGVSVGGVLLAVSALLVWRGRVTNAEITGGIGAVLLVCGLTKPALLKYPSLVWWKFAMLLGYVNARIILSIAFFFVLTPLSLVWRLIGKDPLTRRRANWPGWSPYPPRFQDRDHFTKMY
ncbi:MAG: SxtJ family membrane protein [Vicinamibacterales bacterium]